MMILPGIITAVAFAIVVLKLSRDTQRLLCGYDIPVDVAATVAMMMLFSGTFSGMLAAMIGGLLFSVFLLVLKKLRGYRRISVTVTRVRNYRIPNINVSWVDVPGWRK